MNFRHWLPRDAHLGAAAREAISEPIAQWSANWFARASVVVSRVQADDDGSLLTSKVDTIRGGQVGMRLSGAGKRHLLEALMDVSLAEQTRSECDVRILDALVAEVTADLVRRVDDLLSTVGGGEGEGLRVKYTVSFARNDVLDVVVAAHALTTFLKARLGPSQPPTQPLGRRSEALRQTPLVARAILGHAELSLDEVSGLGVGDVLVLDRALNEKVELRLPESDSPLVRGKMCRNGSQISVQL